MTSEHRGLTDALEATRERELRLEVRRRLGACEYCGRGIDRSRAPAAVPYHTLQRFARGEAVAPPARAAIAAWVEEPADHADS